MSLEIIANMGNIVGSVMFIGAACAMAIDVVIGTFYGDGE